MGIFTYLLVLSIAAVHAWNLIGDQTLSNVGGVSTPRESGGGGGLGCRAVVGGSWLKEVDPGGFRSGWECAAFCEPRGGGVLGALP